MDQEIQIPGYQLLDKIGEGARGTVYRARQLSLDRLVAVKILWPKLATDAEYTANFLQEARAAAKLSHPNIVQAIEAGVHEGVWFFVMELVEGGNLHEYLVRSGPTTERETLEVALHMAQALDFAWRRAGIIHRDIKPANILLTPEGQAKLGDLGLAMRHGSQKEANSFAEGTPQYCAPEQCRGEPNLDTRTDLYGLGATLYHMVCGRPPFDGDDPAKVMAMQITHPPEPPHRLNPTISRELEAVILKLLAKDPNDRFQSPAELVEVVERMRAPQTVAPPAAPVPVARATASVPVAAIAPSPWRKLGKLIARAALVLIGVGAVALVAVFAFRPEWISGVAPSSVSGDTAAPQQPLPSKPQPAPEPSAAKTAAAQPAPGAAATPAKPAPAPAAPSSDDVEGMFNTVTAMVKTNNYVEAEALLQKALDKWSDKADLRTRIETVWQTIQTEHIAYEKKRAEEAAAKAAADKARREQLETEARALIAQIEPWVRAFYLEYALQQLCATLAKSTDADLHAALQDKVTDLQLLCDLKKQLIAVIKKGRLQPRTMALTSGSTIEGRPTAADADGLSVAVGSGSGTIELPWNRFTEPAIYAMLQEAFATGDGTVMAAMALYAWETGRADDAKRYFDVAKNALGDKLPPSIKRRAEQG